VPSAEINCGTLTNHFSHPGRLMAKRQNQPPSPGQTLAEAVWSAFLWSSSYGTIWTQQSKNFTLINGKRQAVDSQELAEAPG